MFRIFPFYGPVLNLSIHEISESHCRYSKVDGVPLLAGMAIWRLPCLIISTTTSQCPRSADRYKALRPSMSEMVIKWLSVHQHLYVGKRVTDSIQNSDQI